MMLDGFRIARFVEDDTALDCFGPLYIAQLGLRMILIFAETLFMTKNHRVGAALYFCLHCRYEFRKRNHGR